MKIKGTEARKSGKLVETSTICSKNVHGSHVLAEKLL